MQALAKTHRLSLAEGCVITEHQSMKREEEARLQAMYGGNMTYGSPRPYRGYRGG